MSGQAGPLLTIATVVKDDNPGLVRTIGSLPTGASARVQWLVVDSSLDSAATQQLLDQSGVSHDYAWVAPAGVYAAMNAAIEDAVGQYIWFVNAGDCLHDPSALDVVETLLGQRPSWIVGQVAFVGVDGSVVVPPPFDYDSEAATNFSRGRFPPHQGTIVRLDVLRSLGGFDLSYRIAADYAVALRLSMLARPLITQEVLADFHDGGLSTREWRPALGEFHRARRQILQPTGFRAMAEYGRTIGQFVRQGAYRGLRRFTGPRGSGAEDVTRAEHP